MLELISYTPPSFIPPFELFEPCFLCGVGFVSFRLGLFCGLNKAKSSERRLWAYVSYLESALFTSAYRVQGEKKLFEHTLYLETRQPKGLGTTFLKNAPNRLLNGSWERTPNDRLDPASLTFQNVPRLPEA